MKIKSFFTLVIFALICILCCNTSVSASSTTASIKTFNVEGLDYIADYYCNDNENEIIINGATYEYGNIALWSALYTKYSEKSDSKYYFLLVEAKVSSNINSLKDGYYRMVNNKMIIDIKANYDESGLRLVKYTPENYGNFSVTETISCSIDLENEKSFEYGNSGLSGGISTGINGGISWSQSIYKDNIIMTPKSQNYNVNLTYTFNNITNKKVNNLSPLRGDCIQRAVFVYELSSYTINQKYESQLNFEINYQGLIQKVACHIFGCTGYEILNEELYIRHKYSPYGRLA